MEKIITIFQRDENKRITQKYAIDSEFLIIATPTEKVDGTNVRLTVRNHTLVRVEKRLNPTKLQKAKGIIEPWYIDASEFESGDKYIWEAARNTDLSQVPDGEWSGEAIGPKIQGNPLELEQHTVFLFSVPSIREKSYLPEAPRTYEELKEWLPNQKSFLNPEKSIEGVVWWGLDGRKAKIKAKDFVKKGTNE